MSALAREMDFDIPARDGKDIYCRLNYAGDTPANKAVILAHGLTGHLNEYIHLAARDFFNARGYDVYRISFYCGGDNHRDLQDTTIQIHANDINDLVTHIKTKHEKLFICGHSYGGVSVLFANPDVTATSLWDATFLPWEDTWQTREKTITPINENYFLHGSGLRFIFGYNMLNEAKNTSTQDMIDRTKNLKAPTNAISVEFDHEPMRDELAKHLKKPTEFKVIKGADHCFTNGDTATDLYNATHQWFERF